MLIVTMYCYGCQDYNKHHLDDKDFELKQTEFTSFSEAFNHMMDNRDHHMDMSIREEPYEGE